MTTKDDLMARDGRFARRRKKSQAAISTGENCEG